MTSSESSIMSVRDMIDAAFGEPEVNLVNHKLIQTILYLLARQLRILERFVRVETGPLAGMSKSSLSVTELKVHPMQKKKLKSGKDKDEEKGKSASTKPVATSGVKESKEKKGDKIRELAAASDKSSYKSDKSSRHGTSSEKTDTDKSSSLRPLKETTSEETPDSGKKTSEEKTDSSSLSDKGAIEPNLNTQDYKKILNEIEEERERELRVIHQRADSRETSRDRPTPMVSLESVEAQYEKLLIVERVPMEDAKVRHGSIMTPTISVVTQEQFTELEAQVKELQERLAPTGNADFPENAQLLRDLRKGASLTDAMAALQLSARLEAAEKTLEKMITLLTDVALKTPTAGVVKKVLSKTADTLFSTSLVQTEDEMEIPLFDSSKENFDMVTRRELKMAMKELYDEIIKSASGVTAKSTTDATNAIKIAKRLEAKLEISANLGNRMEDLEALISDYAEQVNVLDTGLSSQMTNYQEQLTQMQHDLESGLDNMAETLANAGGDTTAVAELNGQFTSLQFDLDNMFQNQKELYDSQNKLSLDLENLWRHIEILKSTKADREEVADALRDKAGIAALNGLVSLQQFDAVQGDFEKRILAAYDKFNNQEAVWQKVIDDLLRTLNEKADYAQVLCLRDEIQKYLNKLESKMNAMAEILGEPRAAAISRQLNRETACLSCATPAVMDLEEPGRIPALPASRASGAGAESRKPTEDGDHLCYPGQPIPHPRDPRSHVCNRYCGGSHTVLNGNLSRVPVGMIITPMPRQISTGLGTDGKVYRLEDTIKPCVPCNALKSINTPETTIEKLVPSTVTVNFTPEEFATQMRDSRSGEVSVTPPPHVIYDD